MGTRHVDFTLISGIEVGNGRQRRSSLGFQFVVSGAQALGEGVVWVTVLRLA